MPRKSQRARIDEAIAVFKHALQEMSDEYIVCRDVKHSWDVLTNFHVKPGTFEANQKITFVERNLVCTRCATERNETFVIRTTGLEKIAQSYVHPKDYQVPGSAWKGVPKSWLVQQEQFRRAMSAAGIPTPTAK